MSNCKNNDQTLDFKELSKKVIDYPQFKKIHGFSVKEFIIDSNTVKNGQSFSQILQEHKVSYEKIHKLGTRNLCYYKKYMKILTAHCTLTPYWSNEILKKRMNAQQISERKGKLSCELKKDRVEISGKAITYFEGYISL